MWWSVMGPSSTRSSVGRLERRGYRPAQLRDATQTRPCTGSLRQHGARASRGHTATRGFSTTEMTYRKGTAQPEVTLSS